MAAKSGIALKKNAEGNLTHVAIDVRKHPQAIPLLKEAGLLPKTQFENDCEGALTHEEALESTLAFVRKLCKK